MAKRKGNYVAGPGRDSFEDIYGEKAHRFALRLPKSLFIKLAQKAADENVSINDYLIKLIDAAVNDV
jgi:predicted HicB family RNase H-like nuclease